jgi:hypothetical protein
VRTACLFFLVLASISNCDGTIVHINCVTKIYDLSYWICETLKIYNLNIQMCKLSYNYKIESGMISMSDENQDKK